MRPRNAVCAALLGAYAVLWTGGIATRILKPGDPQPAWAAPAFLMIAAALSAIGVRDITTVMVVAMGGFAAELLGVHTGAPFGRYSYGPALGPGIGGVPLTIACAWLVLLLFAREVAWRSTDRPGAAIVAGAAMMTALDLVIDPVATRILGYWRWEQPGVFFGVPLTNFAGWFAVSAILLVLAGPPAKSSRLVAGIGASVAIFFAAIAVS